MKVFTRDYRITGEYHPLWDDYFGGLRPCVLDIETTGLDRFRSRVILVGLLTQTDSGVRATQFLAENHYEESKVLEATMDFLRDEGIGYLITYNGAAFDVPFLNSRLEANFMGSAIDLYDFDLYRFIKCGTDLRSRLDSLSQKSVENYYGILSDRGDTITGRESVIMFEQYALTGNSTLEKIILTHNREDIVHLNRLMYLALADAGKADVDMAGPGMGKADRDRNTDLDMEADINRNADMSADAEVHGMHEAIARYGFPAAGGRLSVRPSIKKQKRLLSITGQQLRDPVSCAYFPDADSPVTAIFNSTSASYEIGAPLGRLDDEFYIDARALGFDLDDDPDCINGYLVLNPRTINLISRLLAERYIVCKNL